LKLASSKKPPWCSISFLTPQGPKSPKKTDLIDAIVGQRSSFAKNVSSSRCESHAGSARSRPTLEDGVPGHGNHGQTHGGLPHSKADSPPGGAKCGFPGGCPGGPKNPDEYRKWLLMTEYGVKETKEANEILQGGIEKYKQYKQNHGPVPYA
jgi:hypothetical protein